MILEAIDDSSDGFPVSGVRRPLFSPDQAEGSPSMGGAAVSGHRHRTAPRTVGHWFGH